MQFEPITSEILQEGAIVGALMLPAYSVSRGVVAGLKFKSERTKDFVAVALAGFLFHLVAEATGVNRAYVVQKGVRGITNGAGASVRDCPDSRVCSLSLSYGETISRISR